MITEEELRDLGLNEESRKSYLRGKLSDFQVTPGNNNKIFWVYAYIMESTRDQYGEVIHIKHDFWMGHYSTEAEATRVATVLAVGNPRRD